MLKLSATLVVFCLLAGIDCWTNRQLLDAVERSCSEKKLMCPKGEFAVFQSGTTWMWDEMAIIQSEAGRTFRKAPRLDYSVFRFLQDSFCCTQGECLARCGIYEMTPEQRQLSQFDRIEKQLIESERALAEH